MSKDAHILDGRFVCQRDSERGAVLIGLLVLGLIIAGLAYSSFVTSVTEIRESDRAKDRVRAFWVARAGAEMAIATLEDAAKKTSVYHPLAGVRGLFDDGKGGYREFQLHDDFALTYGGQEHGRVSVSMSIVDSGEVIDVTIHSTGYTMAGLGDYRSEIAHAIEWVVQLEEAPSEVFDFVKFNNNFAFMKGGGITSNGNVGCNGQYDFYDSNSTVNGRPIYDSISWAGGKADLIGYRDDNGDGLEDGNDGGVFAGWDIIRTSDLRGTAGHADNQHAFQDQVEMPNLTDLSRWEAQAIRDGGSITVGGVVVADAVVGDDPGEPQNLYLEGTTTNPIEIKGTVVVRGDVVIHGVVSGQGGIYCGRNAYMPDNVTYGDGPTSPLPASGTEADTETWLTDNQSKDLLGVFAREHIVLGDFTNSTWRNWIGPWLALTKNRSDEDSGEDKIPNTQAGRDGIVGTADDDVLENDGVFTTEVYTDADNALGLIPPGYSVGDPVPGTGEDIDGDGIQDVTTALADFDLSAPITSTDWAGNVPSGGVGSYSGIASPYMTKLEGVFYTNHNVAGASLSFSGMTFNGSLVCRNSSIVSWGFNFNYDARLLGGANGAGGEWLPRTFRGTRVVSRRTLDWDPNRRTP